MNGQQKQKYQLLIAFFIPLLIASLIRFWDLDLRPFHSDEGVNSFFLRNLFERNYYHYDPTNYHGPFLYYVGLIPFHILGLSDFSFRLMPVLFGIMVVALLYPLHRKLGWIGILTAGLLIAISPADSFFSRDTIHEIYLIFFSLGIVVSFFLYSQTRKSRFIYFAAASLAFTMTVKETYIITFAVFALSITIAYFCEWIVNNISSKQRCSEKAKDENLSNTQIVSGKSIIAGPNYFKSVFSVFLNDCCQRRYTIAISIIIFLFINFLFYSSFFTYFEGVNGILSTLAVWTKTGTHNAGGHAKPFIYYFKILYKYELLLLVFTVFSFYYVYKERSKLFVFIALWALIIYFVYSLVPYKTPWLILNITLPLAILGGVFVNGIYKNVRRKWHIVLFYLVYVSAFGCFSYQSVVLNFINYDDDRYELVYVQTNRDIYNLLDTLKKLSDKYGKDITINVLAKSYWPLPWYLREYKNAKFWGKSIANPNSPVILVDKKGVKGLEKKLKGRYEIKRFGLRPGVWLIAYIQKGLYDTVFGAVETSGVKEQTIRKMPDFAKLLPGLTKRCYHNVECIGEPFVTTIENSSISFAYHDSSKKPYRSPFGIQWEGFLLINERGIYRFATKSDDGSEIYIDGNIIVDNSGFHATQYTQGITFLETGLHHIRIDYFDGGGGAVMEVLWTKPGGTETLMSIEHLFHE